MGVPGEVHVVLLTTCIGWGLLRLPTTRYMGVALGQQVLGKYLGT